MEDAQHPFRREPEVAAPSVRTWWVARLLAVPLERLTRRTTLRWSPSPTVVGFVHLTVVITELALMSSVLHWEKLIPSLATRLWLMVGAMLAICVHIPLTEIGRRRGIVWNRRGCELGIFTGCMIAMVLATLNVLAITTAT